jgi:hypothetical protein
MKKILIYLTAILITLTVSCTSNFDDMNTNKQVINTPTFDNVFGHIQYYGIVANGYQVTQFLFHDMYSQYFANLASYFYTDQYLYQSDWGIYKWGQFYDVTLVEATDLVSIYSKDETYKNVLSELDIYMCFLWSNMTDTWGDIPYFNVPGESYTYDSQKSIYYDLLSRLATDVSNINSSDATQYKLDSYDLVFGGDADKWTRFGNSLRLRLAMRLSNVDPVKAESEAVAAINAGCLESNDDVAKIKITQDVDDYGRYYVRYMCISWNEARISKTFTDYMYSQTSDKSLDPRAQIWLTDSASYYTGNVLTSPTLVAGNGKYVGLQNGLGSAEYPLPTQATDVHSNVNVIAYKDFIKGQEAFPIMFYSEVLFLQSEAALRGWTSANANNLFKEGIQASMDYVGVTSGNATDYIDKISDLTGSNEARLKQIITQKWIADFPEGREGWADFRRTDYPDLAMPKVYNSNSTVAEGKFVKRLNYVENAHLFDEALMPAALNTTTTDRMDYKLWWDVAGAEEKGTDGLMTTNF